MPKTRKNGDFDVFKFFIKVFFYFLIHKICSEKVTFQRKLTVVGFFSSLEP